MNDHALDHARLKNEPQKSWDLLARKRLYFGHQSVGFNIMEGMTDIMHKLPDIELDIEETRDPKDLDKPVFAHSPIGQNRDPISKIDDFKHIVESGLGDKVDIAFFKFCYVDITSKSDIDTVFERYVKTLSHLESRYRKVRFLHFTVPLQYVESGPKLKIKRILGRPSRAKEDNRSRYLYNQLVIGKYGKKGRLFDLARYESDLNESNVQNHGQVALEDYHLCRAYTDDGGHLNERGRVHVAEKLLALLSSTS